jgi:hypothetical protein
LKNRTRRRPITTDVASAIATRTQARHADVDALLAAALASRSPAGSIWTRREAAMAVS